MAGELVYQTWQRITGKPWSEARAGGFTTGGYNENLALQRRLLSGWNPYAPAAPASAPAAAPAAPAPTYSVPPLQQTAEQLGQQGQAALTGYLQPLQQAYGEYAAAQGRMTSPIELYKQYETEAGVTERQAAVTRLREQTAKITELLNNLEGNVQQRLSGVLTTAAQRARVVGAEAAPLTKGLSTLGGLLGVEEPALAAAQQRAGTLTGYAVEGEKQKLAQYQTQIESARFTAEQQIESMRDDLTRRYGAAEAERQIAAAKEELERQAQLQKESAAKQFEYDQALQRLQAQLNPPSRGGGGGTTKAPTAKENYQASLINELNSGALNASGGVGAFERAYAKYINIMSYQDLVDAYMQSNYGQKWGPPKEKLADLKKKYGK